MIENCSKCNTKIPDERIHLGYRECVECSSVEPYSAHLVYPHKTGAFVQPVSKETKESLDRLDRRAVKVGGKMSAPTNVKEWSMSEPKEVVKPKPRRQELYTNQVSFNDSYEPTINTYKKKGYVVTINYLKQLFNKNKITMTTKNQLVNVLTTIHMMDRKTRKRYFNGYVG
jgi:hypothetical protein